ncbi:SUMF1/EgtB/PvdO family nonheme iron enzyme [Wenzhouxiangella sp. AB-CW3]|uniref:formylglycine-generating enzyme family protein n=1 Tax=Wenzhouxiangella sp. AB-CW3 TaxID=2771012 RepID=UPI00168C037B|nr:formylglycine-generating enzyme family protein [Wenzhouxiangella sp. AB-CW3]QOC21511.1 SUMF1/EgtB/PvdO family nonheme iron enzyme [Wenzhouxiangella sp. AB-CW3]
MRYLAITFCAFLLFAPVPILAQEEAEEPEQQEQTEEEREERRRVRRLGDVVGEGDGEWSMDSPVLDMPAQPAEPPPDVSLPNAAQDARLQELLRSRAFAPNDPDIQDALSDLMDEVESDAASALSAGDIDMANRLAAVLAEIEPDRPVIGAIRDESARLSTVNDLLAQGDTALEEGRLLTPPDDNAHDHYQAVLAVDDGNERALAGLAEIHQGLIDQAMQLGEEMDYEGAEELLQQASEVHEDPAAIDQARSDLVAMQERQIADLDESVVAAIDEERYDDAEDDITQLVALGHDRERIDRLRSALEDARLYGRFEPGQVFSDTLEGLGVSGPTMVVIPAGSFMMGSPEGEDDRMNNEGPRHRVNFERGFAMSQTEVTVGEFRAFVQDTGHVTDAERAGGSRVYDLRSGRMDRESGINWRHDYAGDDADDDLPVLHVSWNDAVAYVEWLAEQTGRPYRLPSEAEFEYALRAGTQTPYWWGEGSPDEPVENVTGDRDQSPTGARWNVAFRRYNSGFWGPAPVGSLEANPFGLYDMGGNVMEWVEDCWHDSYVRAPGDGSAWVNPGCSRRVIRGGAWSSTPAMSRSAFRLSSAPDGTDMRVGFRVARDI